MDSSIDALIADLDRKRATAGVELPFLRYGRTAFVRLYESLAAVELRPWQVTNRLCVMFGLAGESCPECLNDLAELAVRLAAHANRDIRSYSAVLAVRLSRAAKYCPELDIPMGRREAVVPELEKALQLGLCPQDARFVQQYLAEEPRLDG